MKFHINGAGEVYQCKANVRECSFGEKTPHFTTEQDAYAALEFAETMKHGAFTTVTKETGTKRTENTLVSPVYETFMMNARKIALKERDRIRLNREINAKTLEKHSFQLEKAIERKAQAVERKATDVIHTCDREIKEISQSIDDLIEEMSKNEKKYFKEGTEERMNLLEKINPQDVLSDANALKAMNYAGLRNETEILNDNSEGVFSLKLKEIHPKFSVKEVNSFGIVENVAYVEMNLDGGESSEELELIGNVLLDFAKVSRDAKYQNYVPFGVNDKKYSVSQVLEDGKYQILAPQGFVITTGDRDSVIEKIKNLEY